MSTLSGNKGMRRLARTVATTVTVSFALVGAVGRAGAPAASDEPFVQPGSDVAALVPSPSDAVCIAVIGDFGSGGYGGDQVAELVHGWSPDHVVTVGDNNYPSGAWETIDQNIGERYARYISPYVGDYGPGADANRFWPALGNHDWGWGNVDAHERYFELPGNERYYDVVLGPVHLFVLDSSDSEPDGAGWDGVQARWFESRIAASTAPFQVVSVHYPPFSSGHHGSRELLRWPFADLGVDLVLSGHDHNYERLTVDEIPFLVVGMGGARIRERGRTLPGSRVWWGESWGAVRIDATETSMTITAQSIGGDVIDTITLHAGQPFGRTEPWLVAPGSRWQYSDAQVDARALVNEGSVPAPEGYAPLGYGSYALETEHEDRGGAERWYVRRFTVQDASTLGPTALRLRYDDGAVVWLNGVEIARENVTLDASGAWQADRTVNRVPLDDTVVDIDPALIVDGENVLTVTILQTPEGRGDAFFEASLGAAR